MNKVELIRSEMIHAMKAKDKERKDTLSALLGALKNAEIEKRDVLIEDEENLIIKKEMKQTQETFDSAPDYRNDIKDAAAQRLSILKEFVPEDMNADQIKEIIEISMAELNIAEPTVRDKGKIMKLLMPKVKGKADGKLVNALLETYFS